MSDNDSNENANNMTNSTDSQEKKKRRPLPDGDIISSRREIFDLHIKKKN